jgi:hypothetical protein
MPRTIVHKKSMFGGSNTAVMAKINMSISFAAKEIYCFIQKKSSATAHDLKETFPHITGVDRLKIIKKLVVANLIFVTGVHNPRYQINKAMTTQNPDELVEYRLLYSPLNAPMKQRRLIACCKSWNAGRVLQFWYQDWCNSHGSMILQRLAEGGTDVLEISTVAGEVIL